MTAVSARSAKSAARLTGALAIGVEMGMALTDTLLALLSQWTLTAALLMYLGITRASAQP